VSERPTEFVVQRSKWLRGTRGRDTYLFDDHGARCCLGFVASQCGVADSVLLNVAPPRDIKPFEVLQQLDGLLTRPAREYVRDWTDSALADDAMRINDDADITDAERETSLSFLFAEHGYALRFEP
jgi:3-methyladenine DNA glycosylase Mpg